MKKKLKSNQLKEEFKKQISLFTSLLDAIPDIIFFKSSDGVYLGCNSELVNLLDMPKESIIGKMDSDLFPKSTADLHMENDNKVIQTRQPSRHEELITYPDGKQVLIESIKAPIFGENDVIVGILGIGRNITDRKHFEITSIESKNQLKAILDNMPFIAWLKNSEGKFIAVNQQFASACNNKIEDLAGKTDYEVWPKDLADAYIADDIEVMKSRKQKAIEQPVLTSDGEKWFETFKTPIFNENNEVTGTTGFSKDITDRKAVEKDLLLKDKLLTAVAKSVNELVKNLNFNEAILNTLNIMGNAANVDRVIVYKNAFNPSTGTYQTSKKFEWTSEGTSVEINNKKLQNIPYEKYGTFLTPLLQKKPVIGIARDFEPSAMKFLKSLDILSIMLFPIYIEDYFWGFVGFDDCTTEKIWTEAEQAILLSFSASLASVIERNQKREKEIANEKRISAILNNMRDGIITINSNCVIESCNPAIEEIFGYTFSETIGKKINLLLPHLCPNKSSLFLDEACIFKQESITKSSEITGIRRNGVYFPVELDVSEINYEGRIVHLLVIRDITQRKEVDRMKNEFISTVSHELRTPLTSICGSLDLIATGAFGDVPGEARELLEIASSSSIRLIKLINDILDIEKIEAGKMEFTIEELELMPILEQAIDANLSYANQYNVKIELINSMPGIKVNTDRNRLIQVITNLLSNASKFSPINSDIKVSLSLFETTVRVSVKDEGPGIPEKFKNRIFQKFAQADSSDSRQKGGTGLGLSICKTIIEKLEGNIGFITGEKGTTFYFDLPVL